MSGEGAKGSQKLSIIRCAQILGNQMYRSAVELDQAS
jgi:hypothetical protein